VVPFPEEAGMQVVYQRCAAVDVGKDVVAVAVRLPGDEPDGRQTVKRTFKTFYGVLGEAACWLTELGVVVRSGLWTLVRERTLCRGAQVRRAERDPVRHFAKGEKRRWHAHTSRPRSRLAGER
jgi:hypothetical protein